MFKNRGWTALLVFIILAALGVAIYYLLSKEDVVSRNLFGTGYTLNDATVSPTDLDLLLNPGWANSEWLYVEEGGLAMLPPNCKVIKAFYGLPWPDKWEDVSSIISSKVRNRPNTATLFYVNGITFSGPDPAPGKKKQLRIKYLFNIT